MIQHISRRQFCKWSSSGLIGLSVPGLFTQALAVDASISKRLKLEDFVKDSKKVQSFRNGVAVMKNRKPSDPRSWFFQAAIHGYTADLYEKALAKDPAIASIVQDGRFWNQCPHYSGLKLASANFLIWHRAYVYYFERILRDAAQDADLCLPYWNYTDANQRAFPAAFKSSQTDPDNPLAEVQREQAFVAGLYNLSDQAVSTQMAFKQIQFFGLTATDGFAGAANDLEPDSQGLIEKSPHNNVHFAVGGFIPTDPSGENGAGGLMADVPTAAFDPIFWVHHCNIDRLWSVWDELDGRTWGYSPDVGWFAEKPWWFYDYKGTDPINLERGFYIQPKNLGIGFDTDQGKKRLSDTLPSQSVMRPLQLSMLSAPTDMASTLSLEHTENPVSAEELGVSKKVLELSSKAPVSLQVNVNQNIFGKSTILEALASTPLKKKRLILLKLENIDYKRPPLFLYDVYLNLPENTVPTRDSRNYVGVLSLFGIKHHTAAAGVVHHMHGNIFDVSAILGATKISDAKVKVTFVPVPLLVPARPVENKEIAPAPEPGVVIGTVKVMAVQANF